MPPTIWLLQLLLWWCLQLPMACQLEPTCGMVLTSRMFEPKGVVAWWLQLMWLFCKPGSIPPRQRCISHVSTKFWRIACWQQAHQLLRGCPSLRASPKISTWQVPSSLWGRVQAWWHWIACRCSLRQCRCSLTSHGPTLCGIVGALMLGWNGSKCLRVFATCCWIFLQLLRNGLTNTSTLKFRFLSSLCLLRCAMVAIVFSRLSYFGWVVSFGALGELMLCGCICFQKVFGQHPIS